MSNLSSGSAVAGEQLKAMSIACKVMERQFDNIILLRQVHEQLLSVKGALIGLYVEPATKDDAKREEPNGILHILGARMESESYLIKSIQDLVVEINESL